MIKKSAVICIILTNPAVLCSVYPYINTLAAFRRACRLPFFLTDGAVDCLSGSFVRDLALGIASKVYMDKVRIVCTVILFCAVMDWIGGSSFHIFLFCSCSSVFRFCPAVAFLSVIFLLSASCGCCPVSANGLRKHGKSLCPQEKGYC